MEGMDHSQHQMAMPEMEKKSRSPLSFAAWRTTVLRSLHPTSKEPTMIPSIIRWSVGSRFLVLLLTLMLTAWGSGPVKQTLVDALPDLSTTSR